MQVRLAEGRSDAQTDVYALYESDPRTESQLLDAFELRTSGESAPELIAQVGHAPLARTRHCTEGSACAQVSECYMSKERGPAEHGKPSPAKAFLFSTHLCLEETMYAPLVRIPLPLLSSRSVIPLKELLNIGMHEVDPIADLNAELLADGEDARRFNTVDLQLRGHSISLRLEEELSYAFVADLEYARLLATAQTAVPSSLGDAAKSNSPSDQGSIIVSHRADIVDGYATYNVNKSTMRRRSLQSGAGDLLAAMPSGLFQELSEGEWERILNGATCEHRPCGETLIKRGTTTAQRLLQIVTGSVRIEVSMPGKPQAFVLGHVHAGELLGEISWITQLPASASAVVESEDGVTLMVIPTAPLQELLERDVALATNFYAFLATRAAGRLSLTAVKEMEIIMDNNSSDPRTIDAILGNPAYFHIFRDYISTAPEMASFVPVLEFVREVRKLQTLGVDTPDTITTVVRSIFETYIASGAPRSAEIAISGKQRLAIGMRLAMPPSGGGSEAAQHNGQAARGLFQLIRRLRAERHVFDSVLVSCIDMLGMCCMTSFLSSMQYRYVHELRQREKAPVTLEHFMVARIIGEGGFGTVFEVTKRV